MGIGAAPVCSVDHPNLDFGTVEVGQTAQTQFRLRNRGEGHLTGRISLSNPVFRIDSGGGGYSLVAGEERIVAVTYAPTTEGFSIP